jgi:hypothetical protein
MLSRSVALLQPSVWQVMPVLLSRSTLFLPKLIASVFRLGRSFCLGSLAIVDKHDLLHRTTGRTLDEREQFVYGAPLQYG